MNHNIVTHYQFAAFQIITNITNNNIKLFLTKSQQIFDNLFEIIIITVYKFILYNNIKCDFEKKHEIEH